MQMLLNITLMYLKLLNQTNGNFMTKLTTMELLVSVQVWHWSDAADQRGE